MEWYNYVIPIIAVIIGWGLGILSSIFHERHKEEKNKDLAEKIIDSVINTIISDIQKNVELLDESTIGEIIPLKKDNEKESYGVNIIAAKSLVPLKTSSTYIRTVVTISTHKKILEEIDFLITLDQKIEKLNDLIKSRNSIIEKIFTMKAYTLLECFKFVQITDEILHLLSEICEMLSKHSKELKQIEKCLKLIKKSKDLYEKVMEYYRSIFSIVSQNRDIPP